MFYNAVILLQLKCHTLITMRNNTQQWQKVTKIILTNLLGDVVTVMLAANIINQSTFLPVNKNTHSQIINL